MLLIASTGLPLALAPAGAPRPSGGNVPGPSEEPSDPAEAAGRVPADDVRVAGLRSRALVLDLPGFVSACGPRLCVDGQPWRLHAASVYDGLDDPAGMVEQAQQARLNTVRIVNFLDEQGDPGTAPYDEARWRRVDAMIAEAGRAGLRVLLDLSTYRNLLANAGENPYATDWGPFVQFAAGRVNTVSGLRYTHDPTIALVAFAGEVEPPSGARASGYTTEQITAFYDRTYRQWKTVDARHLLSPGGLLHLNWSSGIDWRAIFGLPGTDVCSIHSYSARDEQATIPNVARHCRALGKPWITEEFGWDQAIGDPARAVNFQRLYDLQMAHDSSGAGFWNLGPDPADAFNVSEATPATLEVVRLAAPSQP